MARIEVVWMPLFGGIGAPLGGVLGGVCIYRHPQCAVRLQGVSRPLPSSSSAFTGGAGGGIVDSPQPLAAIWLQVGTYIHSASLRSIAIVIASCM